MGLQAEQIADIVSMVKDAEDRNTYTLLTTELQKYPAMKQLFKGKGRREKGGEQLSFNAMVASNESAQTTSLFAEIDVAQADLFAKGRVPWRHITNYYAFDEREPELNSRPDDLVDIVKGRRTDCFVDLAVKFEGWFWEAPTGSEAADDAPPYGIQYWCPIVVTTAAGAFQGGDGNATAGCAGLPVATYPKYQNWAAQYTAVSEEDFIVRLEEATWKCDGSSRATGTTIWDSIWVQPTRRTWATRSWPSRTWKLTTLRKIRSTGSTGASSNPPSCEVSG